MKLSYIIFAIYCAIICNSFLNFIWGSNGLFAFYDLVEHQNTLVKNIQEMQEKNNELNNQLQLLVSDRDSLRVLARELGYYQKDETVLLLENYTRPLSSYAPGKIIKISEPKNEKGKYLKLMGILFSIILLIIFILADKRDEHGYSAKLPGVYPKSDKSFKKA